MCIIGTKRYSHCEHTVVANLNSHAFSSAYKRIASARNTITNVYRSILAKANIKFQRANTCRGA